jgi:hypothetical protein
MRITAVPHRWFRHAAVLSGGVSLVLALGAAASPDAVAMPVAAGARLAASGGTWENAQEVAGALNKGAGAQVGSVSCASVGNCSAGGYFTGDSSSNAFVVNEVNGKWGTARAVPEPAGESNFDVMDVSCGSAGNCSAGGAYSTSASSNYAFVLNEVNGKWGTPEEVPGLAKLDTGGGSTVGLSCASAGNCSASGIYTDQHGDAQGFVVNEVNGRWGTAEEVPGLGKLNAGGHAELMQMSCPSAGNCGTDGFYIDKSGHEQAFVVSEVNGKWGTAREVAGALNKGGGAVANAMSCASPGNCSDGGGYLDESGRGQAFVVSEVNGKWGTAQKLPPVPNTGSDDAIADMSCASPGNCSATGSGGTHGFVVNEVHGTWGTEQEVPGTLAVNEVSCASAGNCTAGGWRALKEVDAEAVVVSEVNGTWGTAEQVPGLAKLNTGLGASTLSVSCASPGHCSAGGFYADKSGLQAFVANET